MEKDFHTFPIDIVFSICHSLVMQLQREIDRRIDKKRLEILELEKQLGEAKAYLLALLDTAKWLPKSGDKEVTLRPGSDLARARDFIKVHVRPQHVTDILKGLGKEVNKPNRISLSGSLSGYARKGAIFTKPAPNTFGLIEFENGEEAKPDETLISLSDSPPADALVSGGMGAFGVKMTQPQKIK